MPCLLYTSLQLTIDLRLQQMARHALKQQMEKYKAKRGAVIVMDVRNGAISALVSEPTYDPNKYFENYDLGLFKNWAITDLYEPGSTFKPINLALALDAGVVTPHDTVDDTGKIKIKDATVSNHDYATDGARGNISLAEILQHSSNVGMIKVMSRLNPAKYYHLLQKLGIEDNLEFDIPGYTPGRLKDEVEFTVRAIEPATAAFGQGFSLTPLKLIQLHAALANQGKLVIPHVVRGLADYNGFLHYSLPTHSEPVFTPKTCLLYTSPYGETDDIPLHLEGFYKYQLNDNISVTPGVIYILSPNGDSDEDDAIIGVLRTTFTF